MASGAPTRVVLTEHAERRAAQRGLTPTDLADLILDRHAERRRNPGSADWLLVAPGIRVAYDWPDGDDATTAVVVSMWRR